MRDIHAVIFFDYFCQFNQFFRVRECTGRIFQTIRQTHSTLFHFFGDPFLHGLKLLWGQLLRLIIAEQFLPDRPVRSQMVHVAAEFHFGEDVIKLVDICITEPAVPRNNGGYPLVSIAVISGKAGYFGGGSYYVLPETLEGEVAVIVNIDKAGRYD